MNSADSRDSPPDAPPLMRVLLPIFLVVFVDILGLTIIIPFLPFYAQTFGASPTVVGLLISTYAACQLFSGPMLGAWSDRSGRRKVLILSQIGTLIGFIILARAEALWVVFLSRVIDGVTAGNITVAQAYLADVTPPKERAKGFALIGISFGLGFFLGPAISGFLSHYGPTMPVYGAAFLSFLSVLGSVFLLKEPKVHVEVEERRLGVSRWSEYGKLLKQPELGSYLFQFFCFAFAFSIFFSGFPLFAERRLHWDGHPFGLKEIGFLYAYTGFLGIIIQGRLVGAWSKRYGELKMTLAGFFCAMAGYTLLAGTFSIPILLISATITAIGTGVLRPGLTALISRSVGRSQQGMILGFTQSINSVSQIVGPLLAGFLIDIGWLSVWALTAGLISLIGLGAALRIRSRSALSS